MGHLIEDELKRILISVSSKHGYRLRDKGAKSSKLLMSDYRGNKYNIDMLIEDSRGNPVVIIESKYLRYKKHMRDKGSWISLAHSNIHDTYPTILDCIAILIGDWTKGAKALIVSHNIMILEISFAHMADILNNHGIEFRWGEKEPEKAVLAWEKFSRIGEVERRRIAKEIVAGIQTPLTNMLEEVLARAKASAIKSVEIKLIFDNGSRLRKVFGSPDEAIKFLRDFELGKISQYAAKNSSIDAYLDK